MEALVFYLLMLQNASIQRKSFSNRKKNIPYFIFSSNSMRKTGLICNFYVDYGTFYSSDMIDIHKYFIKNRRYKIVFGLIKKICDY